MKKIASVLFVSALILLSSCQNKTQSFFNDCHWIDCDSIRMNQDNYNFEEYQYYFNTSSVFEYKTKDGKVIYMNKRTFAVINLKTVEVAIRIHKDKTFMNYDLYSYSRFIGFITNEIHYYLELEKEMIRIETSWHEYVGEAPFKVENNEIPNNKETWECAQKGLLYIDKNPMTTALVRGDFSSSLFEEEIDWSLKRNQYINYDSYCTIEYIER